MINAMRFGYERGQISLLDNKDTKEAVKHHLKQMNDGLASVLEE